MKILALVLALGLSLPATLLAQSTVVRGKAVLADAKARVASPELRNAAFPANLTSAIRLMALAPKAKTFTAATDMDEKRLRVGSRRDLATETLAAEGPRTLQWVSAPNGGSTARLSITSPSAASLRAGITARGLPAGAELRFVGSAGDRRVIGPLPALEAMEATRQHGVFWTPLTEGESQTIEVWIPAGANPAPVRVALDGASHLEATPAQMFKSTGAGASQSCNQDVVCSASGNEALARAARSVAKLVFTENGVTYLCTGTLVSDGANASQVPYLYTAAHCIGSQAAAATLNTFWFFEAASCGGKAASDYRQLTRGATLLYANPTTDAALVRLAEAAPAGAWFSGWDAAVLANGTALVALHHPAGDLKKVSAGQSLGVTDGTGGSSYATAAWLIGSTEAGSSGSGLFTLAGGEYVLRGGLRGGSASCSSTGRVDEPSNRDYYSRIDAEAATLRTWLNGAVAPLDDYTGMWSNPAEPGWGMSIIQDGKNHVFAALYIQDANGQPTWVVLPEVTWTSTVVLEGKLYRASGTAFDRPYEKAKFVLAGAGAASIAFAADESAVITLTLDGKSIVKTVRRQPT